MGARMVAFLESLSGLDCLDCLAERGKPESKRHKLETPQLMFGCRKPSEIASSAQSAQHSTAVVVVKSTLQCKDSLALGPSVAKSSLDTSEATAATYLAMSDSLLQALATRKVDAEAAAPLLPPALICDVASNEASSSESDSNSDDGSEASATRATRFTLNGETWTFENPVSLVLAAARQLGMAIGRDTSLLWIADEALLDEFDEDQVPSNAPDEPLSEEVAQHYGETFRQRSAPLRMAVGDESSDAKLAAHRYYEDMRGKRRGARSSSKKSSKSESKKERQRRRLEMREARLSGIAERFTEEMTALGELSSHSASPKSTGGGHPSAASPGSPTGDGLAAPAVWPSALPDFPPTGLRMRGTLPRINSASLCLDQMDSISAPTTAPVQPPDSVDEDGDGADCRDSNVASNVERNRGGEGGANEEEEAGRDEPGGGSRGVFAKGDLVEVDFDDEGWCVACLGSSSNFATARDCTPLQQARATHTRARARACTSPRVLRASSSSQPLTFRLLLPPGSWEWWSRAHAPSEACISTPCGCATERSQRTLRAARYGHRAQATARGAAAMAASTSTRAHAMTP